MCFISLFKPPGWTCGEPSSFSRTRLRETEMTCYEVTKLYDVAVEWRVKARHAPISRKLSMKTRTLSCLALVGLMACAVLNWSCRSDVFGPKVIPLRTDDVRQTLEKCSSETELQAEVDSLFIRFGDKQSRAVWGEDLSATPGLARFGKALSDDPLLDIKPSGYDEIGVPTHVRIRFGQHFHYQYVLIFRTGSDLSSMKSPYEQVTKNIYFRP